MTKEDDKKAKVLILLLCWNKASSKQVQRLYHGTSNGSSVLILKASWGQQLPMTALQPNTSSRRLGGRLPTTGLRGEHVLGWREGPLPLSMSSGRAGARVFWAMAVVLFRGYKATITERDNTLPPLLESLSQVTGCKVQFYQPSRLSPTRRIFIYSLNLLLIQV